MPSLIGSHPGPVSSWKKIYSVEAGEASPRDAGERTARRQPLPALVSRALSRTHRRGRGTGAENIDFSGKCADQGRPGWFTRPNPDEDAADLRDPELARFNRFS